MRPIHPPFSSLLTFTNEDISTLKADKGLALQDIIAGIYDFIATVEFSAPTRVYLLDQLAQVECVLRIFSTRALAEFVRAQAPFVDGREREAAAHGVAGGDEDVSSRAALLPVLCTDVTFLRRAVELEPKNRS